MPPARTKPRHARTSHTPTACMLAHAAPASCWRPRLRTPTSIILLSDTMAPSILALSSVVSHWVDAHCLQLALSGLVVPYPHCSQYLTSLLNMLLEVNLAGPSHRPPFTEASSPSLPPDDASTLSCSCTLAASSASASLCSAAAISCASASSACAATGAEGGGNASVVSFSITLSTSPLNSCSSSAFRAASVNPISMSRLSVACSS